MPSPGPSSSKKLLPKLAGGASAEHPVRVVLLVRRGPDSAPTGLSRCAIAVGMLEALLENMNVVVLDDKPLDLDERDQLFDAAARALVARNGELGPVSTAPPELSLAPFASPLLVVVGAYLAAQDGHDRLPETRVGLLEELVGHEDRYWDATAHGLGTDGALRQRVVALATLAGASTEAEAVDLLRLLPDLVGEGGVLLGRLARWAHTLSRSPLVESPRTRPAR